MWLYVWDDPSILPDIVTEDEFKHYVGMVRSGNHDPELMGLLGFVGFGASYSGTWLGGYARNRRGDNYALCAKRGILRKVNSIKGNLNRALFQCCHYQDSLSIADTVGDGGHFIYCDPPYRNTAGYSVGEFDSDTFNVWAKEMANLGHTVLVSEYAHNVPTDAQVIWSKNSTRSLRGKKDTNTIEVIYTYS
jgi:hypothetical protein